MLSWSGRRSRACAIGGSRSWSRRPAASDDLQQRSPAPGRGGVGRAWHEWLGSGPARAAIEGFRLNGTEVFWPLRGDGSARSAAKPELRAAATAFVTS